MRKFKQSEIIEATTDIVADFIIIKKGTPGFIGKKGWLKGHYFVQFGMVPFLLQVSGANLRPLRTFDERRRDERCSKELTDRVRERQEKYLDDIMLRNRISPIHLRTRKLRLMGAIAIALAVLSIVSAALWLIISRM